MAAILLCDSTSYAMQQFFKVFFIAVLFGLYHAVIFLPVLLRFETPSIMSCRKITPRDEQQHNNSDNSAGDKLENTSSINLNVM